MYCFPVSLCGIVLPVSGDHTLEGLSLWLSIHRGNEAVPEVSPC